MRLRPTASKLPIRVRLVAVTLFGVQWPWDLGFLSISHTNLGPVQLSGNGKVFVPAVCRSMPWPPWTSSQGDQLQQPTAILVFCSSYCMRKQSVTISVVDDGEETPGGWGAGAGEGYQTTSASIRAKISGSQCRFQVLSFRCGSLRTLSTRSSAWALAVAFHGSSPGSAAY